MIHICQGHELSISLEILFKSLKHCSAIELNQITLHVDVSSLELNLQALNIHYKIQFADTDCFLTLDHGQIRLMPCSNLPTISSASLLSALSCLNQQTDVLITLPTSKNQLYYQGQLFKGYTEFLRNYVNNSLLAMSFLAPNDLVLLITDHLPLREVSTTVNHELIYQKTKLFLNSFQKFFPPVQRILMSGLNPHAGENGLLGDEEDAIRLAIDRLQLEFPLLPITGPIAGDVLHFHKNDNPSTNSELLVYMYHDQGLTYFKAKNGLLGSNLTLGMPFLRLSTDHGTAMDLYGKNLANYQGCLYTLQTALAVNRQLHEQL